MDSIFDPEKTILTSQNKIIRKVSTNFEGYWIVWLVLEKLQNIIKLSSNHLLNTRHIWVNLL